MVADGVDDEGDSRENNDGEGPAQLVATCLRLEEMAHKSLAARTHDVIIPSYSAWLTCPKYTPRGLRSLHPGTRLPIQNTTASGAPPIANGKALSASLELRSSIYQTSVKSSRALSSEATTLVNGASANGSSLSPAQQTHTCDTCGTDWSLVRYHSLRDKKKLEICVPCYLGGRFPSTLFSGVEMCDDDWSEIEEHVGTCTAQQCIRKFLEFSIEVPYIQTEGSMGPLRFGRIPPDQADTLAMSVVAFLAGAISSGVAAEAAKTALKELTDGEGGKAVSGDSKDGESTEKKVDDDKMDEDAPVVKDASTADSTMPDSHPLPTTSISTTAAQLALSISAKVASTLASAESHNIRNTLSTLIKLTLTKLENKMTQFEELEEILEEERSLESARVVLVNERPGLKKTLDMARGEVVGHQQTQTASATATAGVARMNGATVPTPAFSQGVVNAATNPGVVLESTGKGTVVNEVQSGQSLDGVEDATVELSVFLFFVQLG
ncbi:hypothetical protein P691DRAFT_784137 [Macrolepiota fuliginosa MF-IS2]|uniref:SANT domain-containing protein n=1 Tax=Macrolepiota fuliginosa MF-IS2 TaxID=1400762 RepID=A0A9P5X8W0_9AGAR|nr:hypothetical protein P691DRAFT_784137 [Macrolepiota fuliginosa MF-IS2]